MDRGPPGMQASKMGISWFSTFNTERATNAGPIGCQNHLANIMAQRLRHDALDSQCRRFYTLARAFFMAGPPDV